jgi:pSer/pThr/pTyr-binding forkhead associated (FHA) protein
MPLCPNCGKDNREGSRFCLSCGTPLTEGVPKTQAQPEPRQKKSTSEIATGLTCSSCGTLNAPGMKFCKMCGSPLEAPQGGAPVKVVCPSCGGQTPNGYKFCQHCGTPLQDADAAVPAPAPAPEPATVAPPTPPQEAVPAPQPAPSAAPEPVVPAPQSAATQPATPQPATPTPAKPSGDMVAKTIMDLGTSKAADAPPPTLAPQAATPAPQAATPAAAIPAATPPAGVPAGTAEPTSAPEPAAAPAPADAPAPAATLAAAAAAAGKATLGPGAGQAPPAAVEEQKPLAKLISVNRDGTDGQVHTISEESIDLGRTQGQFQFADDPYLSDRHCRFYIKNGDWLVQDLDSCNGVYRRLTEPVTLGHGDHLLLGKQVMLFEQLSEHERDLAPAVEHGVLIFGSPLRTPWGRLRQQTVAGITRDVFHLYRSKVTLGREEGDLVFPDDEFMSRNHLSLSLTSGKAQLQDLDSSNGTYLRIGDPFQLDPGGMIRVGDQLLRFELV